MSPLCCNDNVTIPSFWRKRTEVQYMQETRTDKISIIIPAYNAEAFVERAIMSALTQSHKNVQIVVVNDGSSDDTSRIVCELCKKHANLHLINTENHGVSHARNVGMDHADGEFIVFLDADDVLLNDALTDMLRCQKENGLDIVAAKFLTTDQVDSMDRQLGGSGELHIYRGKEALLRSIEDYPETYSSCAKLYRSAAIAGVRFPEGKRIHEDSFFVFQCLTHNLVLGAYNRTVYLARCTSGSASRSAFSEKYFDILELAEQKMQIITQQYPEFISQSKLMLLKANMALLTCLCKTTEKKYHILQKQCIAYVLQNKKSFNAAIQSDNILFWAIRLRVFWLYKLLYRIKNKHF